MKGKGWVDFKEIKAAIDFRAVLDHYGVELLGVGAQLSALCPLPTHVAPSIGKARSTSFSINVDKKIFQCFGCGATGNVLDFVARMEQLNPDDPTQLRKVALELARTFGVQAASPPYKETTRGLTESLEDVVNHPLGFELKNLDLDHPYLRSLGLEPSTIEYFGIGAAKRGLMKDRIAIPIHSLSGELIAYAGRLINDELVRPDCPKYLFPNDRDNNGKRYVFRKSEALYNGHRVKALSRRGVIIVQNFSDVWWLHQCGIQNVVAVMGASMSERQARMLVDLGISFAVILSDGNTGAKMAKSTLEHLSPNLWVRWECLDEDLQPTDVDPDRLRDRLLRQNGK